MYIFMFLKNMKNKKGRLKMSSSVFDWHRYFNARLDEMSS